MNERANEDETKIEGVLSGVERRHGELLAVLTRIADGQERLCELIDEFMDEEPEDDDNKEPQAPKRPR